MHSLIAVLPADTVLWNSKREPKYGRRLLARRKRNWQGWLDVTPTIKLQYYFAWGRWNIVDLKELHKAARVLMEQEELVPEFVTAEASHGFLTPAGVMPEEQYLHHRFPGLNSGD